MMNKEDQFISLIKNSFDKGIIKKLVFSRPKSGSVKKITGRLSTLRGGRILALEYSLPGDTVSHKNVGRDGLVDLMKELIPEYGQINLLTTVSDAEYKISKSGNAVILGLDKLQKRLSDEKKDFESAIEELDKRKSYILTGEEDFLIALGVSDSRGRVHDKKQGKFRQINKFLEQIEAIYTSLPAEGELTVFDLCCGKSYLSFAVYHYLTKVKERTVNLLGIDLKRDVILWCEDLAMKLGYCGMRFIAGDVRKTPENIQPDMVISLHACDIATDIVLETAIKLNAKVILSTPCCHRHLSKNIKSKELSFVTDYPHLKNKLCDSITDALRALRLQKSGYNVSVLELTDPDDTPKNTLIRAIYSDRCIDGGKLSEIEEKYRQALKFLFGEEINDYPEEI